MLLGTCISAATTLTGTVVDAERSTPIAGATVSVDVLIPDSISFNTVSDTSGRYSLSAIPGGNAIYVIRCYRAGFAPYYMRYDALALGDRQVDILLDPQQEVPPGGGGDSTDVSGIVLHETAGGARNPVDLAIVTLKSDGDQLSSRTGADGKYSLRLRRATYALKVEAPACETLTAGGVTVDSAGLTLNILLKSAPVSVSRGLDAGPESFALGNAYPNPFNPATVINYTVGGVGGQGSGVSDVSLVVYDILGREVATLVNEKKATGSYVARFDGRGLTTGVYLYRMTAGSFVQTRKMLLLK